MPANLTLPLRRHGGKHYYNGIIPRRSLNILFEFRPIEFQHRLFTRHLRQMLHALRQGDATLVVFRPVLTGDIAQHGEQEQRGAELVSHREPEV